LRKQEIKLRKDIFRFLYFISFINIRHESTKRVDSKLFMSPYMLQHNSFRYFVRSQC